MMQVAMIVANISRKYKLKANLTRLNEDWIESWDVELKKRVSIEKGDLTTTQKRKDLE